MQFIIDINAIADFKSLQEGREKEAQIEIKSGWHGLISRMLGNSCEVCILTEPEYEVAIKEQLNFHSELLSFSEYPPEITQEDVVYVGGKDNPGRPEGAQVVEPRPDGTHIQEVSQIFMLDRLSYRAKFAEEFGATVIAPPTRVLSHYGNQLSFLSGRISATRRRKIAIPARRQHPRVPVPVRTSSFTSRL